MSDKQVLVVEDEYFIAEDIARAMRENGVDVLGPAGTIEAAMGFLASGERIDAAVLDINLHGDMTYPLADALRSRGVPFLFATGYDEEHLPPEYADIPRCEKPLNWNALMHAVSALIEPSPAA